ncbi:hypothetical protein F5B20DRAFT_531515 [Whalleya microplaca]|nr:hypothetical protein F5B20DRAFT_531515 [Whalleya microplaca]
MFLRTRGSSYTIADSIQFTNQNWNVLAGKPFKLQWTHAIEPVVINLWEESGTDLRFLQRVAVNVTGLSYLFNPPANLSSGTYAFKISDEESSSESPRWDYHPATKRPNWRPVFGGLLGALLVVIICATIVVLIKRRQRVKKPQQQNEGAIEKPQEIKLVRGSHEQISRLSRASSVTIVEEAPPIART